jgi:2-haloacid dehalogenase
MTTTVFLDIDNTLLDFRKCADASLQKGFAEFSLPWTEDFIPLFHTLNSALWRQLEEGIFPNRQALLDVRFERIFAAAGITCDGRAFEARFQRLLSESCEPVDGALDILRYLAGKYTICAASNSSLDQQLRRLGDAGMLPYFTHVFVSEEAGLAKPAPAFFRWCFDRLDGVKKEDTIMIGDSLTADVAGAEAFGIRCCWFNPAGDECSPDIRPWKTVRSLAEIRDIL